MDGLNIYDRFKCRHTHVHGEIVLIIPTIDFLNRVIYKVPQRGVKLGLDISLRKKLC